MSITAVGALLSTRTVIGGENPWFPAASTARLPQRVEPVGHAGRVPRCEPAVGIVERHRRDRGVVERSAGRAVLDAGDADVVGRERVEQRRCHGSTRCSPARATRGSPAGSSPRVGSPLRSPTAAPAWHAVVRGCQGGAVLEEPVVGNHDRRAAQGRRTATRSNRSRTCGLERDTSTRRHRRGIRGAASSGRWRPRRSRGDSECARRAAASSRPSQGRQASAAPAATVDGDRAEIGDEVGRVRRDDGAVDGVDD